MIRMVRAYLSVLASGFERWASQMSEDAKRYPEREFYRGYEQGLRDGLDGAEHAKAWLKSKRQPYPNE